MSEGTYADYLALRKADPGPPADSHESGTRLYADGDGALRTIQSDGTDAPVAVGGSMTVKAVDLGVIHIPTLLTVGATTLHTMEDGEFLASIRFPDIDYVQAGPGDIEDGLGASLYVAIGTVKSFGWAGFANIFKGAQGGPTDTTGLYASTQVYGPALGAADTQALVLSAAAGGPIVAAWWASDLHGNGLMLGPVVAWAADTAYDVPTDFTDPPAVVKSNIIANGTVWVNSGAAGSSGGSEPDFAGNAGGSVADGPDIVWTDDELAPYTTGAVHAVAEIWTPS